MSVGNSEAATVSLQRKQVLLREDVVTHKMNFLAYYYYFFGHTNHTGLPRWHLW